jgi:hypothetical protein
MIRKFIYMTFLLLITTFLPMAVSAAGEDAGSLQEQIDSLKKDFADMKSFYEQRIQDLEQQVNELKAAGPAATEQAAEVAPQGQCVPQNSNPDNSIVGDYRLTYDKRGTKEFSVGEMELAFQGAVDPFSRADFFASLAREDNGEYSADVEEGYITVLQPPRFLPVPKGSTIKFGKFKAAMGKVNRMHPHVLYYADKPTVLTNLFGEEGFQEAGLSVSTLIPNAADRYMNLEFEAFNKFPETEEQPADAPFAQSSLRDLTFLGHFRTSLDLTDDKNIEVGLTAATGKSPSSRLRTNIQGIDFTYRQKPLNRATYKGFTWQSEFFNAQKDTEENTTKSFGWYSMAHWRLAEQWGLGIRYDRSEIPDAPQNHDTGYSLFLNFFQTEFARYTLQFKHVDTNYAENDNLLYFQINFNIGTHGAHTY